MVAINADTADIPSVNFLQQGSDISAPGASRAQLYFKADGVWYILNGGTATRLVGNPMSAAGDLIIGGASGLPTRLAKGTATQVLQMNAGATAPEWKGFIGAKYSSNAEQSIAEGADRLVDFEDQIYDPDGLVTTGASWHFTCPVAGNYLCVGKAGFALSTDWAPSDYAQLMVYRDGVLVSYGPRTTCFADLSWRAHPIVCDIIPCTAGQTLDFRVQQTGPATLALSSIGAADVYGAIQLLR